MHSIYHLWDFPQKMTTRDSGPWNLTTNAPHLKNGWQRKEVGILVTSCLFGIRPWNGPFFRGKVLAVSFREGSNLRLVPDILVRFFSSEVHCKLCYQTDLFHRETALKMVRSMTLLAESVLKTSKLWLEEARLLNVCRKILVPTAFRKTSGPKSSEREVSWPP